MCLGDAFVYGVFKLRPKSFGAYIQPFTVAGFWQFHAYLWVLSYGC